MRAATRYLEVARKHGLDPCQMALAWCMERPFMTSVIFGATTLTQLEVAIGSADIALTDEVRADILEVYKQYPRPF